MKLYSIGLKDLPFTPESTQIIYVESSYDKKANRFMRRHHRRICRHFMKSHGYQFCYMPYLYKGLKDRYGLSCKWGVFSIKPQPAESDYILRFMARPENRQKIEPSLLFLTVESESQEGGEIIYKGVVLEDFGWRNRRLEDALSAIVTEKNRASQRVYEAKRKAQNAKSVDGKNEEKKDDSGPRFSLRDNHQMYDQVKAQYKDEETWQLINEIESRVEVLAQKGMTRPILEQIVAPHEGVSRMVITRDFRILLTDYDNMEIQMTPIVKAVYILFLRHPEGIIFKHLVDYREELKKIYELIREESLDASRMQSVIDVTDPMKNSINEKCARIREAFVTRIDEHLAVNYIVQGERGEPKRIPLHRDFVEWQSTHFDSHLYK